MKMDMLLEGRGHGKERIQEELECGVRDEQDQNTLCTCREFLKNQN